MAEYSASWAVESSENSFLWRALALLMDERAAHG